MTFRASDFGQTEEYALKCRLRFLLARDYGEPETLTEAALIEKWLLSDIDEVHKIKLRLSAMRKSKDRPDEITDEMIEQARNYPVDRLIEFVKGKALCFNHQEKTPSLSHDKARNRAKCFGSCGRSWDAIDIVRVRDGLSFREAVKNLQ